MPFIVRWVWRLLVIGPPALDLKLIYCIKTERIPVITNNVNRVPSFFGVAFGVDSLHSKLIYLIWVDSSGKATAPRAKTPVIGVNSKNLEAVSPTAAEP